MPLADLIVCTAILDGRPALAKDQLIGRLLTLLAEAGHVPPAQLPAVLAAVLRREHLGSTGIGRGLAIPHAKHPAMARPLGVLAVCRPPVWFDALDGEPVDIVTLCLFPQDRPGVHLGESSRCSGGLSRYLADADFCRRLRQARSAKEVEEIIQAGGGMTRREWLACKDSQAMLEHLGSIPATAPGWPTPRKLRLFACAVVRTAWDKLPDGPCPTAVDVAERFADGLASKKELIAAREGALPVWRAESGPRQPVCKAAHWSAGWDTALAALNAAAEMRRFDGEFGPAQCDLLRDLFGTPPFRRPVIEPGWLVWSDRIVARLAESIYKEKTFDRLPILADALLDAGCADDELLGHLRGPGPHWRGCHALDRLTGRG